MYKSLTAADYRKHLKLPGGYKVHGFVVYGTYRKHPFEQFENSLQKLGCEYKKSKLEHELFSSLMEFEVEGKKYWVAVAYGGALLSEYLHLACLFGSKKNVLIGSCGGLKKEASSLELIVPSWSAADESSAKAYQPDANGEYASNKELSDTLSLELSKKYTVHRGATVTYQAMMAETWEDIQNWSSQGFEGVEMESSTVFAVSNCFNVPAAAILMIADNLINEETVLEINYENDGNKRQEIAQDAFDTVAKLALEL